MLAARRADKLAARVAELTAAGHGAQALTLDVTDGASVAAAFDAAEAGGGLPDVVVNNAGVESGAFSYLELEEDAWDSVVNTNLKGAWLVTREVSRRWMAAEQAVTARGARVRSASRSRGESVRPPLRSSTQNRCRSSGGFRCTSTCSSIRSASR